MSSNRAWYCAECGTRAACPGTCPRDHLPLREADALLGCSVGNYVLVGRLGAGGMGEVFRAVNPEIGARVAIKLLYGTTSAVAAAAGGMERFRTEARAANRIEHEGVVKVVDAGHLAGRGFLVMELLDGESLAETVARGPLSVARALEIIDTVLDIVAAAHAKRTVHRDLKPANVFLMTSGRVRILDFGVAKLLDAVTSVTRTGSMVGTPGYMAPEQIQGGAIDGRTDLYAIGVLLYELLVGARPFEGPTPFAIAQAHMTAPPPRLPATFAPALDAVIARALAKAPEQRFAAAAEMRAALRATAPSAMAPSAMAPSAMAPSATTSRRTWWLLAAGATAAVIATTIAVTRGNGKSKVAAAPTGQVGELSSTCKEYIALMERYAACGQLTDETKSVAFGVAAQQRLMFEQYQGRSEIPAQVEAACVQGVRSYRDTIHAIGCDRTAVASAPVEATRPVEAAPSMDAAPPVDAARPSTDHIRSPSRVASTLPPDAARPTPTPRQPEGRKDESVDASKTAPSPPADAVPPRAEPSPTVRSGPWPPAVQGTRDPERDKALRRRVTRQWTRFDPLTEIAEARKLAQTLSTDAELTSFAFDARAGQPDAVAGGIRYWFRSPAASALAPDLHLTNPCVIEVAVAFQKSATPQAEAVARYDTFGDGRFGEVARDTKCEAPLVREPRCSLAEVWQRVAAMAELDPGRTKLRWDGRWRLKGYVSSTRRWEDFVVIDDC